MGSQHIETKHTLQDMPKAEFEEYIEKFLFSEKEKEILTDIYANKIELWKIGVKHGYSESGIKKIHSKLLKKIIKKL